MATLKKMTRIGADVRQIARLLQQKAPENHMLAYITPEEAQFLKDRGGSGMPDAETGVPTFASEYNYGFTEDTAYDIGDVRAERSPQEFKYDSDTARFGQGYVNRNFLSSEPAPVQENVSSVPQNYFSMGDASYGIQPRAQPFAQPYSEGQGFQADPNRLYATRQLPTTIQIPQPEKIQTSETSQESKTFGQRYSDLAKSLGVKEDTLARLGLGGLQAALGARQARLAREDAQKSKEEQQRLAAPYQTKGAELQRQAQAGELTPVGQQQMQTVQAQAAQAASSRGGVGAQQTAARVENLRNQLLQQQNDYGLKLSGIGDQILLGSIRTGLEADRFVNQLTTSYFTNIARTLVGAPTVIQYGVTQ
jgi:hypothetical protein